MRRGPEGISLVFRGHAGISVRLSGELDCTSQSRVPELLAEVPPNGRLTEVDASRLRFIDAGGLTALIRLIGDVPAPPLLLRPPAIMQFLLEVTDLWGRFATDTEGHAATGPPAGARTFAVTLAPTKRKALAPSDHERAGHA